MKEEDLGVVRVEKSDEEIEVLIDLEGGLAADGDLFQEGLENRRCGSDDRRRIGDDLIAELEPARGESGAKILRERIRDQERWMAGGGRGTLWRTRIREAMTSVLRGTTLLS